MTAAIMIEADSSAQRSLFQALMFILSSRDGSGGGDGDGGGGGSGDGNGFDIQDQTLFFSLKHYAFCICIKSPLCMSWLGIRYLLDLIPLLRRLPGDESKCYTNVWFTVHLCDCESPCRQGRLWGPEGQSLLPLVRVAKVLFIPRCLKMLMRIHSLILTGLERGSE